MTVQLDSHLSTAELINVLSRAGIEVIGGLVPLEAGLSNKNFFFEGNASLRSANITSKTERSRSHFSVPDTRKMVLRVNSLNSDTMCRRNDEVNCWQLAQFQGLAPDVIWVSEDKRYYVCEYIEQLEFSWHALDKSRGTSNIMDILMTVCKDIPASSLQFVGLAPEKKLLALFTTLSELPTPQNSMSVDQQWSIYQARMQHVAFRFSEKNDEPSPWMVSWHKLARFLPKVASWLAQMQLCLVMPQYCHRDLNPYNLLLKAERLYCIDFEYACASHPLFDLASIIATHNLDAAQTRYLVFEAIASNPNMSDDAVESMPAALNLFWLFACAWALLMAAESSNEPQQKNYLMWFEQYLAYID